MVKCVKSNGINEKLLLLLLLLLGDFFCIFYFFFFFLLFEYHCTNTVAMLYTIPMAMQIPKIQYILRMLAGFFGLNV